MHLRRSIIAPPDFWWDFRSGLLHSAMSFSRASSGWTYNSSGLLEQKSTDTARFYFDPLTGAPWGLLSEMADNNVCAQSNNFAGTGWTNTSGGTGSAPVLTVNDAISPDGAQNATKVVFNSGAGTSSSDQSLLGYVRASMLTATSNYGHSIYVKGTAGTQIIMRGSAAVTYTLFTLTGGWDRISTKEVAASTTASLDIGIRQGVVGTINSSATVWLYGAMISGTAGVGVTSYIPTSGSTVTRSQDICSIPLSSIGFDAAQGGLIEATFRLHTLVPSSPGYNQAALYLNDGSVNNSVQVHPDYGGGTKHRCITVSGGVYQWNQGNINSPAPFVRRKLAFSFGPSRAAVLYDGTLDADVGTGSKSLPSGMTTLDIGRYTSHGLNGTLESLAYYKGVRADAFGQSVTR